MTMTSRNNRKKMMTRICVTVLALIAWVYPVEGETYKMLKSIPYRDDPEMSDHMRERCAIDLYYPEDAEGFATVIWIHAGGLRAGERYVPGEIREKGFAVAGVGYRLHPHAKAPLYIEDAAAATAWVFKHIADYGGDPDRIFIAGASAGGYLASMIVLDKRWLAPYGIDPDRAIGLISFSGQSITHFTVREERGIPGTQPLVDDLAPLYHVRGDAPPILLVTGDRDLELFGRYEETAYFQRMLRVNGHEDNELFELKGRDHGGVEQPAHEYLLRFVQRVLDQMDTKGENR
jgi:acetyl esterase/lipase